MPEPPFLRLALIGDPVEHSLSPELQRGFLAAAQRSGSYEAIRVVAGDGARAIDALHSRGYVGLNVTTPLKDEAFARADWLDPVATASASVNTLVLGDAIRGYNTDAAAALGALHDAGLANVASARVLVLGAGPTARAAVVALGAAGASVSIWNRTPLRAQALARTLGVHTFAPGRFDAVLSALAPDAALADADLLGAVLDAPVFVDANYGERAKLAQKLGRDGTDGTRMLERSARASFDLWLSASAPARFIG
jgi:shikimate dehydrogenase